MKKARRSPPRRSSPAAPPPWTFLTNHAHVLICIAQDLSLRIRDIADRVGITERGVQRIINELEEAGYVTHAREGRRNLYRLRTNQPLRHPIEQHRNVAALLEMVGIDA